MAQYFGHAALTAIVAARSSRPSLWGKQFNIFRYAADFSHAASILALIHSIIRRRSIRGLSLKTRVLYLIVFVSRYVNSGFFAPPLYNLIFKAFYIVSSALILIVAIGCCRDSYSGKRDSFSALFLVAISAFLAVIWTNDFSYAELAWTFSLWLESVVIVPQLILLGRERMLDVVSTDYVALLGVYRAFYLLCWVRRWWLKDATPLVAWVTGAVQTIIYADFLYLFFQAKCSGRAELLPR